LGQNQVPEGTDLVVVAGPQVGFLEPELQALTRFLTSGGRVLLLLDPVLGPNGLERTGFGPWLEGYGVKLGEDIVVDPTNPLPFYSAETFFANQYDNHAITEALEDADYPVIFSLARSLGTLPQDDEAGLTVTELLRSSPDAWGETNLTRLDGVAKDDADVPGPVVLGVAVEIDAGAAAPPSGKDDGSLTILDDDGVEGGAQPGASSEQPAQPAERPADGDEATEPADSTGSDEPPIAAGASVGAQEPPAGTGAPASTETAVEPAAETNARPGRLVVFGDSDFASNGQLGSVGNPTLLLNALNWLVERENLLAIPAKKADQIQLDLTRRDLGTIYLIVLVALPLACLSVGVAVYLRRRR
jgi:ABC-type uncharacterized transport system involved in gliding motility auxiliary subunit